MTDPRIHKTYETEFDGLATIVAADGDLLISKSGLRWQLVDGVLVTPKEGEK